MEFKKHTVEYTLCIPLYCRAQAYKHYPEVFPDKDAQRIIDEMKIDVSDMKLCKTQYAYMNCVIRQYNLAWEINHYLNEHPNAAIVELGAGLSCLRRQMNNNQNKWYNVDMENVIALRERYIPKGEYEYNICCNLNDFFWFDKIDFNTEDGIVFSAGGLFYYFEYDKVKNLICAMAKHFNGGMIIFDAVNRTGLKFVNAEVKMMGNRTKSMFSLENPKMELKNWSKYITNVYERDYINGYLKSGYRQDWFTRIAAYLMERNHWCFMVHVEFAE